MKKKATQEVLSDLHGKVAEKILEKLSSDECSAQDLAQAIKFLKDNNIQADLEFNPSLQEIEKRIDVQSLPFPVKVS